MKNEIDALKNLSHKNIIPLISCDQSSITVPFMKNGDLFDILAATRFPEELTRFYFKQLAQTVAFIQEQKYIHRDLKLENLMLDDEYNLVLIDFGFAQKVNSEGEELSAVLGTVGSISPQMQMRQKYNGFKNDIFALGVILF